MFTITGQLQTSFFLLQLNQCNIHQLNFFSSKVDHYKWGPKEPTMLLKLSTVREHTHKKKLLKFGHCQEWGGGGSGLAQIAWSTFLWTEGIVWIFFYWSTIEVLLGYYVWFPCSQGSHIPKLCIMLHYAVLYCTVHCDILLPRPSWWCEFVMLSPRKWCDPWAGLTRLQAKSTQLKEHTTSKTIFQTRSHDRSAHTFRSSHRF